MKPNPEQIAFAQYLDKQYGRPTARRYLKLVIRPSYMSRKSMGYSKQSHSMVDTMRRKKIAAGGKT